MAQSKNHDSRVIGWRIRPNICEPGIQRDKRAPFSPTDIGDRRILFALEPLRRSGNCVVSRCLECIDETRRKILIELELHGSTPQAGKSKTCSFASSAA